jgi:hypothetical protein
MWSQRPLARVVGSALAVTLAFVFVAKPAFAEECVPTVAAFPVGHWIASGITMNADAVDNLSALVITETGGFGVTVDEVGGVSGTYSMVGEGALEMLGSDEGTAEASWITNGQLSGTASVIQIDGETDMHIEDVVDVEPNFDDDQWNPSGKDEYGFKNDFTRPFSKQFSPSQANCNQVFGALDGPVQYGTNAQQSFFIAVRVGATAKQIDVQGRLAELIEEAQAVLNMDPVDTDVLARFVLDMLQFEALLASLESCDVGNELDMGAAWGMLQSVMFNTMHHLLDAAAKGAYQTRDVITAVGMWIQGGSLGWRGDDCLNVSDSSEGAMELLVQFEDILLARYEIAKDAGVTLEMSQIAAAAYQYGLPRVIAAVEGN